MLNPEFWLDEEMSGLSPHARLLYMGLWGICDDNYATLPNRPSWIKIQILPYESVNTLRLLDELQKIGKIIKFIAEDSEWWYIKNFFKYQRVDKPSAPKYPKYDASRILLYDSSTSPRDQVSKISKIREVKLSKVKNVVAEATTVDFSWNDYIKLMLEDKREHIRLIGYYFRRRGLEFDSREAVEIAIKRHSPAASKVVKFTKEKINEAIRKCEQMENIEWTLETVLKVLTK